jgi:ketosteroid isomerase-like protein
MKKILFTAATLIVASFLIACDPGANTANKPANAAANNANAAPAANAAAIETDLKKLANDMAAAQVKGDTATLEKLWSDNYIFVGPEGAVSTRAQRLDSMRSGDTKIASLAYDEMSVRSNAEGTGAILIGRVTVDGVNLGKPVKGQYRMTQVWSKTKDGWRLASGQVTPITAASTAPAGNTAAKAPAANTANTASNTNK